MIPIYRGALTIDSLVEQMLPYRDVSVSKDGHSFVISEIILVHDCGPDDSAQVLHQLAEEMAPYLRVVWLARNSGQHAATVAGIASSAATWIVTMDEDGQHHPADISLLLDCAILNQSYLVYGRAHAGAPHAIWRNATSKVAKSAARVLAGSDLTAFTSFRFMEGSRARAVSAYVGQRTYLDSALTWTFDRSVTCVVPARAERRSGSGYSFSRLLSHFWTLVLSSGNRPLRIVTAIGLTASVLGFGGAAAIAWRRVQYGYNAPGWASVVVSQFVIGGLILFALGVVAEYVGALLRIAQGRPPYVVVNDPSLGPFAERDLPVPGQPS